MTVNFTGGNSQTLNLGTNSFTSCTINKTNGTNLTLGAAWNVTGTATSTLTVTNGNLYTNGYTVTCRVFTASGNTDRTIDLNGGAIYVTGSSGTLWNTSHTTATGTAWTKFARSGAAYIQPSSGTSTITVTGGGIASNYTAGATFNGVPPTFQLGNNRNYTVTGQFESLEVNGNFAGTSAPQIWADLYGTPVNYNNVTTTNPVIIGRTGVTNNVSWRAQVTSYTTQNPLSGTPTFSFYYARAVTFTLSSNTATYNLWIDGNDTTGAAWQTAAFTVVCNGNNSTYNENIILSTSTLTYTANGTDSTYYHTDLYDSNTASVYTFGGNASTVHNICANYVGLNTLGTVNFNFGTLYLSNTYMSCRIFNSATGTGASGNQRIFNFNGNWIMINGNHRSGTNGTGTLTIATLNNTVCTSDSGSTGGGFWLQTTGTCTTGSWQGTYALRFRVEALAITTLNASITNCNLRSLEFFGPVNFATAQTINLINDNASITWDEQGTAFNLTNLTATIAAPDGGTVDILRNGSSGGNANWRLGTLSTLDASLNNDQTFNIYAYVRTLSLTKNTGTFYLHDVDYAQTVTCSGGAGTTYYHYGVRTSNPFTATFTPITGTSVAAAITKVQMPVKSTSGSGTGATFNIAKTGTGTTYSGITVAALGSGYTVGDTITISGAELNGADGTNDLTFTITAATQYTVSGQSAGSTPVGISGTAVNTAQTRTNVPVKSSSGGGNDALFSVTKTGTGVVYFGVTTAILTSGTAPADGSTIVISGANLGGVDGTNDLTFTFRATGTQHIINSTNLTSKNTFDHTAGDLEIAAGLTLYCRTFQSSSTTNIREWRWHGWVETSGTGLVSIGSAGANIRGNFLDTYTGGFRAVGTGANAFGTNVLANAPRVQLGNNDGSLRTYASVGGNISHLIFQRNDYAFTAASSPTIYGNISFIYIVDNYFYEQQYGTWTNLTINWQPLRNGADLQLYSGYNYALVYLSPTIPTLNINTPENTADNGISITLSGKFNTVAISTTHNYTITTAGSLIYGGLGAGLSFGTSLSITGNNCTFNFNGLGSYNQVANPTITLGAATSTNNIYNINATSAYLPTQYMPTPPNLSDVDITQLGGTTNWNPYQIANLGIAIRDLTFTGPGVMNLDTAPTLRNFSSSNSNARTLNMGGHYHTGMSGNFTISNGTNLTLQNAGTLELTNGKTINTSGLLVTNADLFNLNWTGSGTFGSASVFNTVILYTGAVLSTTAAVTINLRDGFYSGDGSGGTGPFTGLTVNFPAISGISQLFNVETPTVIPSVTALGNCTINYIRTTTLTLNPGPGYTATLDSPGHITTLTMTGTGGTITLNNLNTLQTLGSTSLSFAGNATYNLNGFIATAKAVSCAGTNDACVYNINNLDLTGTANANRLLFDGRGTLNVGSNVVVGNFSITNTTIPRTLNFNTNWIYIKAGGIISCAMNTTTVTTTADKQSYAAGGIRTYDGNTGSLTVNGQTEANALNLYFDYNVTLAGTLAWRNLVGAGNITNATGTLTIYGDYIRSGLTNANVIVNFSGTDSAIKQAINFGVNGPNTSTMGGASLKVIEGDCWIKTLTTQNCIVIIDIGVNLYCDSITVQGTDFRPYGSIYVNNWNTSDTSTYYWKGEGFLRIGEAQTTNPAGYSFAGNTTWNSARVFNSTSSRGAGTGPNLIQRGASEGYYTYATASLNDPHRVKTIALYGTDYTDTNLIFRVCEGVQNYNSDNYNFGNLKLILNSVANSSNNLTVFSSFNMSSANNPVRLETIPSTSTLSISPLSGIVFLNKIEFTDTANSIVDTNSKTLNVGKIICGTADFGNSVVTLSGGNDTIFDANVATNNAVSATKNHSAYIVPDPRWINVAQNSSTAINLTNSSFTIECWIWPIENYSVQPGSWPKSNIRLISKLSHWELFLQPHTGCPGFFDGTNSYISTTTVNPQSWNHVAATFDNSTNTLVIYLNGAVILTSNSMTNVGHSDNTVIIIGQFYSGFIKDVRIVRNAVVYSSSFTNSLPNAPLVVYPSEGLTRYSGNAAGNGGGAYAWNGGGGGGAGAGSNGTHGSYQVGGNGGNGTQWPIDSNYYGGGGGGNSRTDQGAANSSGGIGGGGRNNVAGTANTGGGGGGGGAHYSHFAGAGGSGVVKVRYPNTLTIASTSGNLTISTQTLGDYKISTFTFGTGTINFSHATLTNFSADVLVVAGGGGGGADLGGGGGGGEVAYGTLSLITATNYNVVVGQGGSVNGTGENSTFHNETTYGGGRGGSALLYDPTSPGLNGGNAPNPGGGCGGANTTPAALAGNSPSPATMLLTCQNSTLIDNSTSPKTLTDTGLTRYLFSPTTFANGSEVIVTGPGNKNFIVRDNNLNVLTNNSPFYHTGSGDGAGWLNLVHTESRTIGTVKNGTSAFSKGIVCSATLKDVTATNIYSDVINVIEGSSVSFYVSTYGIADNTTLYWTNSGTANSTQLGGASSGSFTVMNNQGLVTINVPLNAVTSSTTTIIIQVRTTSTSGTIIATSLPVIILNTTYSLVSGASSAVEGDTITWTVTTTGVPDGTVLYWTDSGSTNSSDWVGGVVNGTVTMNNNNGTISRTLVTDAVNENNETSILQIRSNGITGTILATNQTINILNQAFSVTGITSNLATANDGDTVIWTVTTTGVPDGTMLTWTDSGSTNSSDWVGGALNGTVIISNNIGTISRVLAGNLIGSSTSVLQIRTGGINGTIHRTASTVNINVDYNIEYLIVAGGGGGGRDIGGGGGAGGLLQSSALLSSSSYSISVGAGGAGSTTTSQKGGNGSNSSISGPSLSVTAIGGGGGNSRGFAAAGSGGSGGGGATAATTPGSGTAGQGNSGASGAGGGFYGSYGGGGGGAGAPGSGKNGGNGLDYSTWASATGTGSGGYYAGGGAGGIHLNNDGYGSPGLGGGGQASNETAENAFGGNGAPNTGGGGGGQSSDGGGGGGNGGSGIVIIRYQGSQRATGGTIVTTGGYTYHTFTSNGSFMFT